MFQFELGLIFRSYSRLGLMRIFLNITQYKHFQQIQEQLLQNYQHRQAETMASLEVVSDNVCYNQKNIKSHFTQRRSIFDPSTRQVRVTEHTYAFETQRQVGRVGLLMVGMGGNNGSTILGGLLANKHQLQWHTNKGLQQANMFGSMTQCSTMKVGEDENGEVYLPIKEVIQLLDPTNLIIGGWDISSCKMDEAMARAQVFDYDLQQKLKGYMSEYQPMKSIYYSDFIATNQRERADHVLKGDNQNKFMHYETIVEDIQKFKKENKLDKVIILWTANTERFAVISEVHQSFNAFMKGLKEDHPQISPSMIFAIAAMKQNCVFINGSPQNTLCPAVNQVPESTGVLIGNDFKTGQTKFKTAFMDFLVGAGIKPKSIVSYNHLGNNDGKNLSSQKQFKSKEASKSECINDILQRSCFYKDESEHPDHTVVIKYVPEAGDSKKAIDEYTSDIFMGGTHTFLSYNICEDSLLAAGIIIDLIVLGELMTRVQYSKEQGKWESMKGVVSFLGYLMKAPQSKGPVINSLTRQRLCIENLIRVLTGLPLEDDMLLNYRL